MPDFLRYLLTRYTVSLYLIAATLLLVGAWLEHHPAAAGLLTVSGSGVFITTLVSSFLNFYFQRDINRSFSIVRGAEQAGVKNIYRDRGGAMSQIDDAVEKPHGPIDILTVAGTDLFHGGCRVLKELDTMWAENATRTVRVLLLDPRSKHAVDRAALEEGITLNLYQVASIGYDARALVSNILFSLDQLQRILENQTRHAQMNFNLTIRTYDTAPSFMFVRAGRRIFLEQYHYGISEEEGRTNLTRCIGKKVPILEFDADSAAGQLWLSHFNYIWETSARRTIVPGFAAFVLRALQDGAAARIYEDAQAIEERYLAGMETSGGVSSGPRPTPSSEVGHAAPGSN